MTFTGTLWPPLSEASLPSSEDGLAVRPSLGYLLPAFFPATAALRPRVGGRPRGRGGGVPTPAALVRAVRLVLAISTTQTQIFL